MRHPNPCKYGPRCHYNRHNKCFYSHVTMVNGGDDKQMKEKLSKIKEMENKVEEMQKKMKHIENKINKTSPDNSDLAKEVEMDPKVAHEEQEEPVDSVNTQTMPQVVNGDISSGSAGAVPGNMVGKILHTRYN